MSASITLNCLVYGEHHDRVFSVQIPGDGNVMTLREAIKAEKNNTFRYVDANTLQLWNVYIPIDELSEETMNGLGLESKTPLRPVNGLSGVFSGRFEDDHLHIVVRPEGFIQTNEPRRLQLNCFVLGEDRNNIFSVEIPGTENVSTLKEAIKDKKNITFRDVEADTLTLWRVSVPDDRNFELKLGELDLVDEEQLFPLQVLSSVFSDPPLPEHVHIVVKPPPPHSLSQQPQASTSDAMMAIAKLEAAQRTGAEIARSIPAPSSSAMLQNFITGQKNSPIWNGRPSTNCGIPIQLYHPSFAKILRISRGDAVEIDLRPETYSATQSLFHLSAALYSNEDKRVAATRTHLGVAIGHGLSTLSVPCDDYTMHFDGGLTEVCGGAQALVVLEEDKNEVGTDGCDPSHQCSLGFRSYYSRNEMEPIRNSCCCPTFLIAIAGPWMCILGAVYVESAVVQQLTDFIWIGGHPYDDRKLESVTRILASLRTGIAELQDFYRALSNRGVPHDSQRFFPFVRHYSVEGRVVNFSYKNYLFPDTLDTPKSPPKAIFIATTEVERRDIIVKFTQRYNVEAHRHLATEGLAPELLYCSKEDPDSADLAGLIMVVMEHINGKTAYEQYGGHRLDQHIFDQVEKALGILHDRNIVFGDFRYPNIMITEDQRVLLVDFDWCGEHEKDTYPVSLNDNRYTHYSIDWHPDVKRGGRMAKEHDTFMLNNMRPQSDITPPPATTSSQERGLVRLGNRKTRA